MNIEPVNDEVSKLRQELLKLSSENKLKDKRIKELERMIDKLSLAVDQEHSSNGFKRLKKYGVSDEVKNENYLHEFIYQKKELEVQNLIRNVLLSNELLKHLEICQLTEIIDCMYEMRVEANENVIEEGSEPNKFFVVQSGQFYVFKGLNKISEISDQTSFGEFCLLHHCPRNITIKAITKAILWVIGRETFKQIMHKSCCKKHVEFKQFLRNVKVLRSLSDSLISKLSDHMEVHVYHKNQNIIRQGHIGNNFFIIQSGSVYIKKVIPGSDDEQEIGKLIVGDYFGELSLLNCASRSASVYSAEDNTTLLSLCRIAFIEFLADVDEIKNQIYDDKVHSNDFQMNYVKLPTISKELSDIQKIKLLGIGSFAKVYIISVKGHDNQSFALKCLKKAHIVKMKQEKHVLSEKSVLSEINCSFIIKLYQTYRDNKFVYFLLEICLGGELWNILKEKYFFDDNVCKFCLGCVIGALEYLHNNKIVYRDLKPENLLVSEKNGYLKLCDFGFSKKLSPDEKTYTFCGTPEYIAPEIILNKSHDYTADLWSLGILTYEFLIGNPPFRSSEIMKIYALTLKGIESLNLTRKRNISIQACSFISELCKMKPAERLGNGKYGFNDIKSHKYFQGFDWNGIDNFMITSPFKPKLEEQDRPIFMSRSTGRSRWSGWAALVQTN